MDKMKRFVALVLAVMVLFAVGCSCSSKSTASGMKYEYMPAEAVEEAVYNGEVALMDAASAEAPAPAAGGIRQRPAENGDSGEYVKKIIYTANMTIRTDDVELACRKAQQICEQAGGYLSDSCEENYSDGTKYAYLTLRVPAEALNGLLENISAYGKVENKNLNSNDITRNYYDIEARLDAAKAEEKQLLKLLENCQTVEETLMVRAQMESIREQIESYQTTINLYDNDVAYSTVYLTVLETERTAPAKEDDIVELWKASDVGRKIVLGFQNGWRFAVNAVYGIGIVLANALIPIIIVGGVALGIFFLVRAIVRKKKTKKNEKNLKEENGEEPNGKR